MDLEIWQAGEATKLELTTGAVTVGGAESDGVRIAGLPDALLQLSVEGALLTVRTREALSISDVLFPPGVPRLLMPGESISLPGEVRLRRPFGAFQAQARDQAGTAQVLKQLLSGGAEPGETQAATLICLTGLDLGRVYPLAGTSAEIGRGAKVDVRVRDRAVSRRHARIVHRAPGGYFIEDLGGPNATFVNGEQVEGRRALSDGAVIELGQSMLRFSGPVVPPPAASEQVEPANGPAAPGAFAPAGVPSTPSPESPLPPSPGPAKVRRSEWVLICLGATLAITGLFVSWGLA